MHRLLGLALAAAAALALAACGNKSSAPAAGAGSGTGAAPPARPADAAVAVDAPAAPEKPRPISRQIRGEYKLYLENGRKAAKAARWPEAIAALSSALAAIPGDDRALAELSFAAMSAGDHDQARRAGRAAVLAATDPKIKAAALYNLGRVEEHDAPTKAIALYRQSLALRPNPTVEKRLAAVSTGVTYTPSPPPCTTPVAQAALCPCLDESVDEQELDPGRRACELVPTGVADFMLARYLVSSVGEEAVVLVARSDAGWSVVAPVDTIYNPGAFGISEEWAFDKATDDRHGTHTVVGIYTAKSRTDSDLGIDEVEDESTRSLVLCVRDLAGGPPRCPVDVPLEYVYTRERMGNATDEELAELSASRTKGLPLRTETKLSVEVGADGLARVRAVVGRPDGALLGDKRLWQ